MTDLTDRRQDALYQRVAQIIEAARTHVSRTVNTAMVHAYWLIGSEIVEVEQAGKERADYGEEVVKRLASRLSSRFGKGFSYPSVKRMKQFYLTFPEGSSIPEEVGDYRKGSAPLSQSAGPSKDEKGSAALSQLAGAAPMLFPPLLTWTHYLILLRVENSQARAFYEIEAAREGWATRELERQVASLLYERLAKSRDKEQVLALAKEGQRVGHPRDVLKDPMVLEFLELEERAHWLERDLEQAIIDRLESFLLEFGKGFCFVGRQKRLTIDGDHFYVDLVFYNRLLRCFVLIDLKLGKLTHQDLGQMQMYVNFFDRQQRVEDEKPTIGIVLCSDKNDAMVRITLPEDNEQIHASRYQLYLPTEDELREELVAERERLEQARRLSQAEAKTEPERSED
jgi:predicted nuclease of restriction endonuclease-like (RecB) superfamily